MIVRIGKSVGILLYALNCMQVQVVVHQMEAVDYSCSNATTAEHQVTFGEMQFH